MLLTFGKIVGQFLLVTGDSTDDADRLPDLPPASGQVTFTPVQLVGVLDGPPNPAVAFFRPVICMLDSDGYLVDPAWERGVWLPAGFWQVTVAVTGGTVKPYTIEVTDAFTDAAPGDLATLQPVVPPPGQVLVPSVQTKLDAEAAADRAVDAADRAELAASSLYVPAVPVTGVQSLAGVARSSILHWTLTGNVTISAMPASPFAGQTVTLVMTQDATGGRTVTLPAGVLASSGLKLPLEATAGAKTIWHLWWSGVAWVAYLAGRDVKAIA